MNPSRKYVRYKLISAALLASKSHEKCQQTGVSRRRLIHTSSQNVTLNKTNR